jgi:hypothetical protein
MKILGLGHSHIVAIAKGCYELQNRGVKVRGAPIASRFLYLFDPEVTPTLASGDHETGARLNPRLAEILAGERPDLVLLSIGGNEHIALSVLRQHGRIDFILGEQPDLALDAGATMLTEAAIRETLREKMSESCAILVALRRATAAPLVCIEPPPPLPDAQILAYPKEFFRRVADPDRLSPEVFRYKMWRVQSGIYRALCAAQDICFASVDGRFIAPPGVLAREAWGADATHANSLFGEVMVEQAIRLLEARKAAGG